ncbi:MAG: putative F420-dependent oxidoreductase, Rv2161c family [Actinomycetia bacterium]|nr:putative F420-dependent oxidoreductase, Rv2161c family [Actinomycetes bacterium]
MNHWTTYPLLVHPFNPEFVSRAGITRFAEAAEAAGFDGIGFTDHPAPSQKWLSAGGHDALDPFVALTLVAAVTERLRLIPNILVLPYRNPFLVAKAAATLDALSEGRFVLSVATGYLRGEYRALGVDFEQRNVLFDEALSVLRGVWSEDEYAFEGTGFVASAVSANPKPVHVPIWIGGNSALTRRRVAAHGDGWNPFPATATLAQTSRTVPLDGLDDLAPMLQHLWRHVDEAGRDRATIDVAFTTGLPGPADDDFEPTAHLESLDRMAAMGVTWNSVSVPGDSLAHAIEALDRYGSEVIAHGSP